MVKEEIINKNLALAETLLEITTRKPYLVRGSYITLEEEDVYKLSSNEIIPSLKMLEKRGVLGFENEEDKYEDSFRNWIELNFDKVKLNEFIEIAKDKFYKIPEKYKTKKELSIVVDGLSSILKFKDAKEPVSFSEINKEHRELALWIADYAGLLKITYEESPDVEWKDSPRPQVVGLYEVPVKFVITNVKALKKLSDEIEELFSMSQIERIKLFLAKNKGLDWKCAKCKRWLNIKLEEEKQIAGYLNDFYINKFKVCYDCRKRNYFTITSSGQIKFSITRKKTLKQIGLEKEKQKVVDYNKAIKLSNKLRKAQEKSS